MRRLVLWGRRKAMMAICAVAALWACAVAQDACEKLFPYVGVLDLACAPAVQQALSFSPEAAKAATELADELAAIRDAVRTGIESGEVFERSFWKNNPRLAGWSAKDAATTLRKAVGAENSKRLAALSLWARGPLGALDKPWCSVAEPPDSRRLRSSAERLARACPAALSRAEKRSWMGVMLGQTNPALASAPSEWPADVPEPIKGTVLGIEARFGPFPKGLIVSMLADDAYIVALADDTAARALGVDDRTARRIGKIWEAQDGNAACLAETFALFDRSEQRGRAMQLLEKSLGAKDAFSAAALDCLPPEVRNRALAVFARIRGLPNAFNGTLRNELSLTKQQQDAYVAALQGSRAEYDRKNKNYGIFRTRAEADAFVKDVMARPNPGAQPPLDFANGNKKLLSEIFTATQRVTWARWEATPISDQLIGEFQAGMSRVLARKLPIDAKGVFGDEAD